MVQRDLRDPGNSQAIEQETRLAASVVHKYALTHHSMHICELQERRLEPSGESQTDEETAILLSVSATARCDSSETALLQLQMYVEVFAIAVQPQNNSSTPNSTYLPECTAAEATGRLCG